jgi:flagellar biosynthesis/type III secretory pathway M-ring protein FliF/YscJ
MDILKQQFARIQEQFAGLSATQRMLAASLVAIMVLTVMLWGRYATTADMVPVLNSSFDDQSIIPATMALKGEDIDCQVSGDRILVPADKHDQALAVLSFNQLLPSDSKGGFDDIIKMTNPFDDDKKNELMFTHARAAELAQIIREWHGVAEAQVVINPVYERHIGESLKPSAVVSIRTRGRDIDIKHMVDSAASTVASANSAMDRSSVSVVIDGHTYKPHDDTNGGLADGGELYEQTAQQEQYVEDKIAKILANYANPLISVSVNLDVQSKVATKTAYDPTTSVQKEAMTDNQTDESNQASSAGEPGVSANVGASVNTGPAPAGNTTSTEHDKTEFTNAIGSTTETITTPSGQQQVVSASVGLPRSHFVDLYLKDNPGAKEPDEDTLQKSVETIQELSRVKHQVQSACGLKTPDNIFVDLYTDTPVQLAAMDTPASGIASSLSIGGHIKEIAIGALATLSLFMVSMMVRKGGPAPVALAGGGMAGGAAGSVLDVRETPIYNSDDEIAAVVGGGQGAMDGMELDDEAMKSQQVVEQVASMVKENPDAAASLVKRWMSRT